MKRILLLTFFIPLFTSNSFAQFCGMSEEQLKEFGAWTCPEYRAYIINLITGQEPSPGFPGSSNPIVIPEVVVNRYTSSYLDIFLWTNITQPNVPFIFINKGEDGEANDDPYKIDEREKPCSGDPLKNSYITPSDRAKQNVNGGRFGFTRTNADGSKKYHAGVDLFAEPNTPIFPIGDGTVTRLFDGAKMDGYDAVNRMGNYIEYRTIVSGQTYYILYGHMNYINGLKVGDTVSPNIPIGLSGATGNVQKNPRNPNGYDAIPHVHMEVRNDKKERINPEDILRTKFDKNGKPTNPCEK